MLLPCSRTPSLPRLSRTASLGFAVAIGSAILCVAQTSAPTAPPPIAPVRPVTDTCFGQTVVDPYRYLEDQKSLEVIAFMRGQADYTRAVLDSIPGRKALRRR